MKFNKTFFFNLLLASLATSVVFFFSQQGFLNRLELASLDFSFRLRGHLEQNPRIIIIEISDSDIAKVGRWPWSRSWHAALVKSLYGLGAKSVYFDVIFSEPAAEEDDLIFEEAIKQAKNVYLPSFFQGTPPDINNAVYPLSRFSTQIKGTGFINIYPDTDGTIRRFPLVFSSGSAYYPSAALKIAMDDRGLSLKEVLPQDIILSGRGADEKIPLVGKNTMLINWLGKWQRTFKHYSFLQVLSGYKDFSEKRPAKINTADFKDSICVVGLTAVGLYDIKPVPVESEFPGIGIFATVLSNLLDKDFLYPASAAMNIFILYLLGLIPAFLILGEKPLREIALVILTAASYFLLHALCFRLKVVFQLATPLVALFSGYFTVGAYNFLRVSRERQRFFKMSVTDGLTGLYNIRYFKMLLATEVMLAKPNPAHKFCVVMTDVDHFKHFNDTYGHQVGDLVLKEVAEAIKGSLRTADIVARYGGEEMIVLLRGAELKDGLNIAEKIRKSVAGRVVKDGKNTYQVTISLGVSLFKHKDDVDSIIKRADDGLYQAKESGRNRVCSVEKE